MRYFLNGWQSLRVRLHRALVLGRSGLRDFGRLGFFFRLVGSVRLMVIAALLAMPALAQEAPFAPGWTLTEGSVLRFQSIKHVVKPETNTDTMKAESSIFAGLAGEIAPDGNATLHVMLDSIDTTIDLRNVRMRFLFFETFRFPEALITAKLDAAALSDLPTLRRKSVHLAFTLDLHGVQKQLEADVMVTQLADDRVVVTSTVPIPILAADFGLSEGITKLQEAAKLEIVPLGTISFDLVFARKGGAAPAAPVAEAAKPLETAGNFGLEECTGRFEILSRSGNIQFRSASARLLDSSSALLDQVADIALRCPGLRIEVSGHTDSDGPPADNQRLSEARAQAVADYLVAKGLTADRFVVKGYGEDKPAFANDSAANKARNRRIEFAVVQP